MTLKRAAEILLSGAAGVTAEEFRTARLMGADALSRIAALRAPYPPCIGGDPSCPCQDGDMCHYKGPNAWPLPKKSPTLMDALRRGTTEDETT